MSGIMMTIYIVPPTSYLKKEKKEKKYPVLAVQT